VAAAVALWLGGCGQPEVVKSPDLVQPVWRAPEAEAPVATSETGSNTSGADPAPAVPSETDLDAPAPGADGSPTGEGAETTEVAEAAPAQLDAADEPPILEEPKPRSTAKASKSKKKKKAKPKATQ